MRSLRQHTALFLTALSAPLLSWRQRLNWLVVLTGSLSVFGLVLATPPRVEAAAFIISGPQGSSFTVDDDLDVYLNGNLIYTDGNALSGTRPPTPPFDAKPGDVLRFVVRDTYGFCASLSPLFLTCATDTSQSVQADPGFNLGCGRPGGDQGVVHDHLFTIPASLDCGLDLTIGKTASPDPVGQGGQLTYTLTIRNSGTSDVSGVDVVDVLPSEVAYRASRGSTFSCSHLLGRLVTCSGGTIPAGGRATITIRVRLTGNSATIINSATVNPLHTIKETNFSNNTATVTTKVSPFAREFSASPDKNVLTGATIKFEGSGWDPNGDPILVVYDAHGAAISFLFPAADTFSGKVDKATFGHPLADDTLSCTATLRAIQGGVERDVDIAGIKSALAFVASSNITHEGLPFQTPDFICKNDSVVIPAELDTVLIIAPTSNEAAALLNGVTVQGLVSKQSERHGGAFPIAIKNPLADILFLNQFFLAPGASLCMPAGPLGMVTATMPGAGRPAGGGIGAGCSGSAPNGTGFDFTALSEPCQENAKLLGSILDKPTIAGVARRDGDLMIEGDLLMDAGLLCVTGNLTITGGIKGLGTLVVNGGTIVQGAINLRSSSGDPRGVTILAGGDIQLGEHVRIGLVPPLP